MQEIALFLDWNSYQMRMTAIVQVSKFTTCCIHAQYVFNDVEAAYIQQVK